ncbi:MAG TPA: Asp-tRNA(Asn)/Glu-tRNA(Gln) amidotransferase subunit GatA [Patescibacteria group bacterium]|nr:Asp-tRNA(Asn)/Glu-tRNA(Gln) amidotransferase subunit GatA [Patescibacteria group bacterium]
MANLNNLTISKASELLEKKEVSSVELTNYYLERIEKLNPELGAYLSTEKEYALKKARESDERIKSGKRIGILDGIPCSVKDVITTKDIETTAASKILEGYIAPYSATVVRKIEEQGAVILGKNNCDEFAMGSSTENSAYMLAKNPWDLSRVPGGSSGGSAVAVAADLCVFSFGTETGGSIRQPASLCSVVGLKPTYGRNSRYGSIAYGSSLDQIGVFGKCVEDISSVMHVIAGKDSLDSTTVEYPIFNIQYPINTQYPMKDLKIGIPKEYFGEGLDSEVEKIVRDAIDKYKEMGAEIIDISLPNTEYATPCYYLLSMAEASSNLARYDGIKYGKSETDNAKDLIDVYFKTRGKYFGDEQKRKSILGTFELSAGYYDAYYRKAQKARSLVKKDFDDAFEKIDCIMCPVSPFPAFKIGEKKDDPLSMYLADIFTISANLAGICALSIPAGFTQNNLPVGLQIMGPRFDEDKILQIAKAYEEMTQWHTMFPSI